MSSKVLWKNFKIGHIESSFCKPRMHPLISPPSFTVTSSHRFYLFVVCTWGKHSKQLIPKGSNFSQQKCTVENAVKAAHRSWTPSPDTSHHAVCPSFQI